MMYLRRASSVALKLRAHSTCFGFLPFVHSCQYVAKTDVTMSRSRFLVLFHDAVDPKVCRVFVLANVRSWLAVLCTRACVSRRRAYRSTLASHARA